MRMQELALLVLLLGASLYENREGIEHLCRYWFPVSLRDKLVSLYHRVPRVELYYCDGLDIRVKRGHTDGG